MFKILADKLFYQCPEGLSTRYKHFGRIGRAFELNYFNIHMTLNLQIHQKNVVPTSHSAS